jgi:hypothetical protein
MEELDKLLMVHNFFLFPSEWAGWEENHSLQRSKTGGPSLPHVIFACHGTITKVVPEGPREEFTYQSW